MEALYQILSKKFTEKTAKNMVISECCEVLDSIASGFEYIRRVHIPTRTFITIKENDFFHAVLSCSSSFVIPEHQESYFRFIDSERISSSLTRKNPCETLDIKLSSGSKGYRWARFMIILSVVQEEKAESYLLTCSDITRQKRDEQQTIDALNLAFASAQKANAAKNEFLSRVSHDIRTPMNAIIGTTSIAQTCVNDTAKIRACLDKISISSKHLMNLINEILDMSRIESGHLILIEEKFNLYDLIRDLILIAQPQMHIRNQNFSVNISSIKHADVIGDSTRMKQCFLNFITNAIKYTPDGGFITMSVFEKETERDGVALFEFIFEDNGYGMDSEFINHIFEPFSRNENFHGSNVQGTGLGMAIAYNIIRIMDGDIQVTSEPNAGSKFVITLYLKLQPEIADIALETLQKDNSVTENASKNYDFKGKRILIVEDNELNMELACDMLSLTGAETECATNGKEALEKIESSPLNYFDLILMDIQMPVMNGCEAAAAIRSLARSDVHSIPIFAMTANVYTHDIEQTRNAGMCEHIAKPINMETLFATIKKWLH